MDTPRKDSNSSTKLHHSSHWLLYKCHVVGCKAMELKICWLWRCYSIKTTGGTRMTNSITISKFVYYSYQAYLKIDYPRILVKVPDDVSLDVAALVPCGGITAFSAVKQLRESVELAQRTKGW